ncbi:MAG: prophage regulatory protein [Candidatus Azotimanducaceae bacterium]|jgi:prophage regulatory protein
MGNKIIRLPAVMEQTGLSRSTIYAKMAQGDDCFPQSVKLGERAVGWASHQIDEWIDQQIQQSCSKREALQ